MSPIAAAWLDAWRGRDPRSDDPKYRWAYKDALAAVARADARPLPNHGRSEAATGKVRTRAQSNTFIFAGKARNSSTT